jgi:hypothetical protein
MSVVLGRMLLSNWLDKDALMRRQARFSFLLAFVASDPRSIGGCQQSEGSARENISVELITVADAVGASLV